MFENDKISSNQFMLCVTLFTIGTSILLVPSLLTSEAKQDGWIGAILGLGVGLTLVTLYIALGKRYPQMTFSEYTEEILGKWLGKFVSFLFWTYPFLLASTVLWDMGSFMTTEIMPETPIQAIYIIFTVIVIMGAKLGLEVLGRASEILFPWGIGLFFLVILMVSPQIQFENIQPVLEEGIKPVLRGSYLFTAIPFLQLVVFLVLMPKVTQVKQVGKSFFMGTLFAGIVLIIITLTCILVLGAEITLKSAYPSYLLAKKINIGDFFQRMESFVAGIWFITIYFKLTLLFYISAITLAQIFNLKDYRFLVLPLGMIMIVLGLVIYPNIAYANTSFRIFPAYALTYGLMLPLLLLVVDICKKRWNAWSHLPKE